MIKWLELTICKVVALAVFYGIGNCKPSYRRALKCSGVQGASAGDALSVVWEAARSASGRGGQVMSMQEVNFMEKGIVQVFYGPGKGKTSAAVGQCIRAASLGQSVIIIQFLKGKDAEEFNFLEKLEPDIKLFRFEKEMMSYHDLHVSKQKEERQNILNGFKFARKVIDTSGCDVLVLDEVLGLIDVGIVTLEDILELIDLRNDYCRLVLTGRELAPEIAEKADIISKIDLEKDCS